MMDLVKFSARQLISAFANGDTTPTEAMEQTLAHLEHVDPSLNAIASCQAERALEAAAASTRRWRSKGQLSVIDGLPVTVKESIDLAGTRSPWGVAARADAPEATEDHPPVSRLREAGAVIFAKTTAPDLSLTMTGISSLYGITRNPWDMRRSPGGSSSGAGAATAAGIGHAAIGTDLGGSVRVPAARCGLVGLKPTQGRIPHLPPVTMRSPGVLARSVEDLAMVDAVIAQPDERDFHSLPPISARYRGPADNARGLRIGVLADIGDGVPVSADCVRVLDEAAAALGTAGAVVSSVDSPLSSAHREALLRGVAVRLHEEARVLPSSDRGGILPELEAWSSSAATLSAADLYTAQGLVLAGAIALAAAMRPFDYVLSPVTTTPHEPADDLSAIDPFRDATFTVWLNQTGHPAATVPFGLVDGMPVGVQVIGRRFDDCGVLAIAGLLEALRPITLDWPFTPRPLGVDPAGESSAPVTIRTAESKEMP